MPSKSVKGRAEVRSSMPAHERESRRRYRKRLEEALASNTDVWGNEAMARPEGPTYDNIKDYLVPLGSVAGSNPRYPITLSLPEEREKTRVSSDGSEIGVSINPWRVDGQGWQSFYLPDMRARFLLGAKKAPFGKDLGSLKGPSYLRGYLPIVGLAYEHGGVGYKQEVFTYWIPGAPSSRPQLGTYVKLSASPASSSKRGPKRAKITVALETPTRIVVREIDGPEVLALERVQIVCLHSKGGRFDVDSQELRFNLDVACGQDAVYLLFPNRPLTPMGNLRRFGKAQYDRARKDAVSFWEDRLGRGARISVPERVVDNAARSLVISNFILTTGDEVRYSWGNPYDRQYMCECGWAILGQSMFGYPAESGRYMAALKSYAQEGVDFLSSGFWLKHLCRYHLLFRDDSLIEDVIEPVRRRCDLIVSSFDGTKSGLLEKENFCGDIQDRMHSLSANSIAWRGLRDASIMLRMTGRRSLAEKYSRKAGKFRRNIIRAVEASMVKDSDPPFIPINLLEGAKPFDKLTATRYGNYYDLTMPMVLAAEIFARGDYHTTCILDYLEKRGGILLGLIRFKDGFDDLYGLPYSLCLLRRGEVDKFLVGFYGKLAHGFTRDTFVGCETHPMESFGGHPFRRLDNPPNSSSNAFFLQMLRHMLVLEIDSASTGVPDELRLLHGTPRAWLANGRKIEVRDAPTCFGRIAMTVESAVAEGRIVAKIDVPDRDPIGRMSISLRTPRHETITGVRVNGRGHSAFDAKSGTIDISGLEGGIRVEVSYGAA